MKEVWIDIKGYEGIYEVSNKGRVRTHKNKTTYTKKHGVRKWKQRIMKFKGNTPKTGYRVSLWKEGKQKDFLVARLVAFNFYNENIDNKKLTVNHIDGNRMNNELYNLELITLKENIQHGFNSGLYPQINVTIKILSSDTIHEFNSLTKASRFIGHSHGYISKMIKTGKLKNEKYEILKYKAIRSNK